MLFPTTDIKKAFDVEIAVSTDMINAIDLWTDIFQNEAPWLDAKQGVFSLEIAPAICKEFADTATNELVSEIKNNEYLNKQYQYFIDDINDWLQWALAKGGIALKPYIADDEIIVDYVQADSFFPVSFDNRKRINAAIFIEQIVKGKNIYSRLEYQKYENGTHTFINLAFKKENYNNSNFNEYNDLGKQILLSDVPEWEDITPEYSIENVKRPLFAYFKVPGINNIDTSSPLGMPIYKKAIPLIQEADKQYGRYIWEYEGGELAIDADVDLFEIDEQSKKVKFPQGKQRLFRKFDGGSTADRPLLNTFAPTLRDSNYADGFNNILKRIEFNVGLAYGDLSDPNSVEKTAEEIRTSKFRKYNTVTSIQNALDKTLEHVAYIMNVYAVGLGQSNSSEVDIETDWGDSVLIDSEKQRNIDLQEVNAGLMPEWKYKMKWQGLTEEEAKREVAETSGGGLSFEDEEDEDNPIDDASTNPNNDDNQVEE